MSGLLRLGVLVVALSALMTGERLAASAAQRPPDPPGLRTAVAVIAAGGGAEHFKTTTLLDVLAGPLAGVAATRITKRFGARDVKGIVATFDFLVADLVRAENARAIIFPATPAPDPKDGRALAGALYAAGTDKTSGRFDVERMLDDLLSRRVRIGIMRDADAKYGVTAVARCRSAMQMTMGELKNFYFL